MNRWLIGGIALMLTLMTANAQTLSLSYDDKDNGFGLLTDKPHEVKLNLLSTALFLQPEIAYDYTINTDMSVGARTSFSLKKDDGSYRDLVGDFQISPYFRWHFYKNSGGNAFRGFYVEANAAYAYMMDRPVYDSTHVSGVNQDKTQDYSNIGLGIGFGYRWITKGAWSFELGTTVGKYLLDNSPREVYTNAIFTIGKRF